MGKMRSMKPGGGGPKMKIPSRPARPMAIPRPMHTPKPAIRPQSSAPRPVFGQRPTAVAPQRGANQNRVNAREVRKEAFRQQAPQQAPPVSGCAHPLLLRRLCPASR